jgi:hypothetical protein
MGLRTGMDSDGEEKTHHPRNTHPTFAKSAKSWDLLPSKRYLHEVSQWQNTRTVTLWRLGGWFATFEPATTAFARPKTEWPPTKMLSMNLWLQWQIFLRNISLTLSFRWLVLWMFNDAVSNFKCCKASNDVRLWSWKVRREGVGRKLS